MKKTFTPEADNVEFRLAADFIEHTNQHVFLTGKAGSGKTTFLKYIRKHSRKNIVVAAPTGVAAVNAGGVTLHSLLQLPVEPFVPSESGERRLSYYLRMSSEKIGVLRAMDVLIIDEVSMLRADILDAVDVVLRRVRRNKEPFGGVQMIYIGDMFQLPPVVKDEEWKLLGHYYTSSYFFHAHTIRTSPPLYIELKTVYRQQNQHFVELLNKVRYGTFSNEDLQLLNTRYNPEYLSSKNENSIILTTHNYLANRINKDEMNRLQGETKCYTGTLKGEFSESTLPVESELILKVGARVMFLKNDRHEHRRYYNGRMATVIRFSENTVSVLADGDTEEIEVRCEKWKNLRYTYDKITHQLQENEIGSFVQLPLRLAWAVTVHKSQGLTFDGVIVDVANAFAPGQVYVALSRCRTFEGLQLLSPLSPELLQTNPHVIRFMQSENSLEQLYELLEKQKTQYCRAQLLRAFDWNPMLQGLYDWKSLLQRRKLPSALEAIDLIQKLEEVLKGQHNVARRFVPRLTIMIDYALCTGDFTSLKDELQRAVAYFHVALSVNALTPLDEKINELASNRKMKTHRKMLENYRSVVAGSLHRLCTLELGDFPLVEGFSVPPSPQKVPQKPKK